MMEFFQLPAKNELNCNPLCCVTLTIFDLLVGRVGRRRRPAPGWGTGTNWPRRGRWLPSRARWPRRQTAAPARTTVGSSVATARPAGWRPSTRSAWPATADWRCWGASPWAAGPPGLRRVQCGPSARPLRSWRPGRGRGTCSRRRWCAASRGSALIWTGSDYIAPCTWRRQNWSPGRIDLAQKVFYH